MTSTFLETDTNGFLACTQKPARGAELLARMSASAPLVIHDEASACFALDLIKRCFEEQNIDAKHQSIRALDAIVPEIQDENSALKVAYCLFLVDYRNLGTCFGRACKVCN